MNAFDDLTRFEDIDFSDLDLADLDMSGIEVIQTAGHMALPETGASCCSLMASCCCSSLV